MPAAEREQWQQLWSDLAALTAARPRARGRVQAARGHWDRAAAEFKRIIDYPELEFTDPVVIAARLSLAKTYLAAGDPAKAQATYREFLDLWKSADEDIPILKQARGAVR